MIAEAGEISTTLTDGTHIGLGDRPSWEKLPESGYGITEPNVSAPVSLAITNPDDSLIHGNDPYPGKMVNLQVLNKLEPLTPYIVYFVLEGESQDSTSAVYAFRFETRKVSRPVLQATLSNPSASVSSLAVPKSVSGAKGVKKDADVNYLVINDLKIGDPLNGMMADHWDPTYAEAMNISPGRIAEARTKYIGYSFLEAMATQFVYNDENYGTVFDLFCSPSTQEMLGGWFNTAQTDGTNIIKVGIGQGSGLQLRTPSWQQKVDCTKELSNASGKYWFVACGQGDGSAYAFTAARYLTNPNEKHPMVNAISFESEAYATREEALAALNQGVSGPLSIAFDNPIYYAYNGNELMQVVDIPRMPVRQILPHMIHIADRPPALSDSSDNIFRLRPVQKSGGEKQHPLSLSCQPNVFRISPVRQIDFGKYIQIFLKAAPDHLLMGQGGGADKSTIVV